VNLPRRTPRPAGTDLTGRVIPAQPGDADTLSQVIASAFHDLPQSRWLIPDQAARRDIFPGYFRLYVDHAMASGVVHTTADRTAAALWLPVSEHPAGPPAGYDAQLAAVTGAWTSRFRAFDATLGRHHPAGTAHHHLAILAVRPDRQGQGTGSLLLRAYHQVIDRNDGAPAYLEAASPRTRQLYQRHGYADRPGAPFRLPDGGPPMWPMWRQPHSPPATA
jgi:GNAT superfamily N-acetyltransferase